MKWLICLLVAGFSLPAAAYREATVPFGVKVQGIENRFAEFGVYARPGEILALDLIDVAPEEIGATFDSAPVKTGHGRINLKMPGAPGTHRVELTDQRSGSRMRLNVFVMWQHDGARDDVLNGYRIGQYPRDPFRGLAVYRPPEAFVEVTPDNAHTRVSPNFTLGQFVCKQGSGFPKYVVLRPQLVQKLELVLGELNAVNPDVTGLTVMSGYRTPAYNRSLGNGRHSRHLWGGAADVYVDANGDGIMDDLNGDGRRDRGDAEWLATFIDRLEHAGRFGEHIGGIGTYNSNAHHGPFVHVDARGYRARW
ncbi:MAG TPA: D-Ala-D-Ala carboxypeptidase family metallohydrolase [Pseudomonadales bacterium]|jgi:hypothetical protein